MERGKRLRRSRRKKGKNKKLSLKKKLSTGIQMNQKPILKISKRIGPKKPPK